MACMDIDTFVVIGQNKRISQFHLPLPHLHSISCSNPTKLAITKSKLFIMKGLQTSIEDGFRSPNYNDGCGDENGGEICISGLPRLVACEDTSIIDKPPHPPISALLLPKANW